MTQPPIIDVNGNPENGVERALWLRNIYAAACLHVCDREEPLHEVCYWPGSIQKMRETPSGITIYWFDAVSMSCFRWAIDAAWNDHGDDTPVEHIAMDELHDSERNDR